jgi:hypothetical protein
MPRRSRISVWMARMPRATGTPRASDLHRGDVVCRQPAAAAPGGSASAPRRPDPGRKLPAPLGARTPITWQAIDLIRTVWPTGSAAPNSVARTVSPRMQTATPARSSERLKPRPSASVQLPTVTRGRGRAGDLRRALALPATTVCVLVATGARAADRQGGHRLGIAQGEGPRPPARARRAKDAPAGPQDHHVGAQAFDAGRDLAG